MVDVPKNSPAAKYVKCVVWDLDNTLWDGVLLEQGVVSLRDRVVEIIKTLDARGILHSIASRNDKKTALAQLRAFDLDQYFLYPQINWNSKVSAIKNVADSLNIGLDSLAFVDDQPFELEEVKFSLPEVLCLDQIELDRLLDLPEMNPRFITSDSRLRREMYLADIERNRKEEEFIGSADEFLATLDMRLTISRAGPGDLQRAEELTVRTHQLNTTGHTYSYEQLDHFRQDPQYLLLMAGLEDKYGSYGKIGLALLRCDEKAWTIKLMLTSCRVMSRGVGMIMLNHVMSLAKRKRVRLLSEFVSTERNRMMYVSYKFAGFKEIEKAGDRLLLENDMMRIQPCPDYVKLHSELSEVIDQA